MDVIRKQLEQAFVMTNQVPLGEFPFRDVFGDAEYLSRRAILRTLGDDFASTHPAPPSIPMPHAAFTVDDFLIR